MRICWRIAAAAIVFIAPRVFADVADEFVLPDGLEVRLTTPPKR